MTDWRAERDRALLALENEKRPAFRAEAAEQLHHLAAEVPSRAPEFTEVVPRMLSDAQPEVKRSGIALATVVLPQEEAIALLISRLRDEESLVRLEATGRLADMARPELRGALAGMLEDAVPEVRFEAARGIAALKHPAGLEVLIDALDADLLRFRALGALAELEDARALPAVKKLFSRWLLPAFDKTQAAGVLARLGDADGAAHLLQRSRKTWSQDRALAVELLGEVKAAGALERLKAILDDPKDSCRGAAARGLGRLGDERALPWLLAVLQDMSAQEEDRLDAADGLWRLGLPEGRERVRAAVSTFTSPEARQELDDLFQEGT
ncbi:HEAT repeat domain-containing protein [Myxococcus sp. K38C18041901]|uniref:HEAT repeat domain-containing protein n=1 Tax=Myxococcus guangdongensis TaxID=2906760 RepID=UPI0020A77D1A|nr:HEAT repeat domain-containing protein [Myxococcus guangdongensis]MCP3060937.1 HEAT repeat domain-containing protein [Myxococcus guangdongensis]